MHNEPKRTENKLQIKMARGKRAVFAFLALTVIFFAAYSPSTKDPDKTFTLVLDAGHGGSDPGNLGTGRYKTTEKDIALDVVKMLGKSIAAEYPEIEIVYTRKDDSYPTLERRTVIANEAKADLFISVHLNANNNKAAYGSETFVMGLHKSEESLQTAMKENSAIYLEKDHDKTYEGFDPKNPDTYIALSLRENVYMDNSISLAKSVQDQFHNKVGRKDRGVKQAGFYVISFTNMPSILIELGFLTNAEEEDFMQTEPGKERLAAGIFKAFKEYKQKADKTGGAVAPASQEKPVQQTVAEKTVEVINNPSKPAEKPITSATANSSITYKEIASGIKYQVQFLTSTKALNKKSPEMKGLTKVDEFFSNNIYKYLAGSTDSFKEAKQIQQKLRDMGFKDAFIVAFEDGKRIDLNVAMSKTK